MRKGSWLIRPVVVDVRVGSPIETAAFRPEERNSLIARVRTEIENLLAGSAAESQRDRNLVT
jgi:hypothetical protein